jgi:ryanodine receptor 2
MDFYWHYSGKETIDQPGKESFCRAITVAKQIFRSLTEYIQAMERVITVSTTQWSV